MTMFNLLTDKSYLTAVTRTRPSAPMQYLYAKGLLVGDKLDYGCGKGFDASFYKMDRYDPFYFNDRIPLESYDTITCIYCLNVIEDFRERRELINNMMDLLKPDGNIYIAVRADKKNLNGLTKKGTWQGYIVLANESIYSCAKFDLYNLKKGKGYER